MRPIRTAAVVCTLAASIVCIPATAQEASATPQVSFVFADQNTGNQSNIILTATTDEEDSTASSADEDGALGSINTDTVAAFAAIISLVAALSGFAVAVIKNVPGAQDALRNLIPR